MGNKLIVTAAPHITGPDTTQKIMQRVCIALLHHGGRLCVLRVGLLQADGP